MARKVFISVLGSTNYGECIYESKENNYISGKIRFIQEATLQMIGATKWETDSVGYVFVTEGEKGSYNLNWKDNGHKDWGTQNIIPCEGLKTRLDKLNLPFKIEDPIFIKDGNSEDEIWEVFETVFSQLNDNDEIYFDVTHGFRYLPMLILVLANYSKFLKNIKVKSVSYGNYEGRDDQTNIAPIINLTSFSKLQDISQATSEFVSFGKMSSLGSSLDEIISPISKKERKLNDSIRTLRNSLVSIDNQIASCRIRSIKEAKEIKNFFDAYNHIVKENLLLPAQKLIFEKVHEKMNAFVSYPSNLNVIAAAMLAYENKMLQQAYTLGFEIVITLFTEKIIEYKTNFINTDSKLNDEDAFRMFASSLLGITDLDVSKALFKNHLEINKNITLQLLEETWIKDLRKNFITLQNNRNIINHGKGNIKFEHLEKQFITDFKNSLLILETN